ncbi:calcium-dependent protein kinase [Tritrichomonas foetus]|uniref:Calcium-dependent protein kinase n=1 Tax=Tritrichomonas foetus TaxID=1144522 RepID=A0A1J4K867_9EUKA|nr:calcium-dependent protein kinase [Tritrichomonas foetus]|eukprot:OHT05629.1 calcium-dependent protein kinase [Tritrichomonas foetus]
MKFYQFEKLKTILYKRFYSIFNLSDMSQVTDFFSKDFPDTFSHYRVLGGIDRQDDVAVFHAIDIETGRKVAIKFVNIAKYYDYSRFLNGLNIVARLSNKLIISHLDVWDEGDLHIVVMDDMPNQDLFFHIMEHGHMVETDAAYVMYQLALSLQYIHGQGIIHNRLRLENILIQEKSQKMKIVLTGFSSATEDVDNYPLEYDDQDPYLATELNNGHGPAFPTFATDVYSLGIVFYEMLTGTTPQLWVQGHPEANGDPFKGGSWGIKSEPLKDLIAGMIATNPAERLTAEDIVNHELFRDLNEGREKSELETALVHYLEEGHVSISDAFTAAQEYDESDFFPY